MSISLNNHEDRISAIEAKNYYSEFDVLFNGSQMEVYLGDLSKYNFLLVMIKSDRYIGQGSNALVYLNSMFDVRIYCGHISNASAADFTVRRDGKLIVTNNTSDVYCKQVIGLKIYYIFRYNIQQILKLISPILKF